MKRIVKKNQIVLTLLAVMIAVAGYLSYAGKFNFLGGEKKAQADGNAAEETVAAGLLDISDEDVLAENQALSKANGESLTDVYTPAEDGDETQAAAATDAQNGESVAAAEESSTAAEAGASVPGEAVLTNGVTVSNYVSQMQLNREQVRSKNKETLMEVINNAAIADDQKQAAVDQMIALTAVAEKENAAETLLGAKGFTDSVVCINDGTVDVVVGKTELTDAERAQIEDIVKRKTEVDAANVVITLMDLDQ
ncbi:MAG: stage III sporulation protein AH [Subdoligranulum variabile]|uniref:SpoIIIAH-like family protein n=1 Tax=Qiania dongpingensis TaxID=2763669 RepID=A0A7G9G579_9FIRM|nr:SpoIIIAH-like family protein [Qiania dongpingensis]PWM60716.1 MAG: stage III sporulation protein AH [Subdoligranulum variabile]QNM05961.1 SpoIIIAH-like family protein [Qiania dongpingensis]